MYALSFFSGAMGLDLGIEKAGFRIKLACEIDNACRKTIHLNKPETPIIGDIRAFSAEDILNHAGLSSADEIDLIFGGPPCQAFSTAGKRGSLHDDRGNVFLNYLDLILKLRPKIAVIENVRGLLSAPLMHRPHNQRGDGYPPLTDEEKPGGALRYILKLLENSGYVINFNLYNSANFGTPQKRERVIIVCSRVNKRVPFLMPTHSEFGEKGLPTWKTLKDAIGDIQGTQMHYLDFPEKRIKYYKLLSEGQNWKNLPIEIQKEALGKTYYSGGGKTGFYRRLSWNEPSPTLVTHPAMPATDLAHPIENRPLSIEEYKRIQEFPDNWKLHGSLIDQYRQIGNAVPVSLGEAIGKLASALINKEKITEVKNFHYSRYKYTDMVSWMSQFKGDPTPLFEKV